MSPVSRSSGVGARVRRRSKQRSAVGDADYVDPWDIENEIYVKRLSVVEPPNIAPESRKASSRRTSNCYYDIGGFEEEQFQNDRLYNYNEGGEDAEYWMQSAYGDYYYYDEENEPVFEQGNDQYFRYKPIPCIPYPEGHTYEECQQKHAIYSDEYYIPMSSSGNLYPSPMGCQLYAPTRRSLASNPGSQLKRVYETRKSRMALPAEDGGFYERDYGSVRNDASQIYLEELSHIQEDKGKIPVSSPQIWRDLPDNNRLSVLSGYYSDEIPGDMTDDSFAPYSELRGPPPPIPASHFGLTKHGHLKIDYSCNWSSLDKFIGHSSNKNIYGTKSQANQVYG